MPGTRPPGNPQSNAPGRIATSVRSRGAGTPEPRRAAATGTPPPRTAPAAVAPRPPRPPSPDGTRCRRPPRSRTTHGRDPPRASDVQASFHNARQSRSRPAPSLPFGPPERSQPANHGPGPRGSLTSCRSTPPASRHRARRAAHRPAPRPRRLRPARSARAQDAAHDESQRHRFALRIRSALNGGRPGGDGPSMSARASTSAPQSGHTAGSGSCTSMANCVRQPRHSPATVSRRSGNTAGRCAPSNRRALNAPPPPPSALPRPSPPPAAHAAKLTQILRPKPVKHSGTAKVIPITRGQGRQ